MKIDRKSEFNEFDEIEWILLCRANHALQDDGFWVIFHHFLVLKENLSDFDYFQRILVCIVLGESKRLDMIGFLHWYEHWFYHNFFDSRFFLVHDCAALFRSLGTISRCGDEHTWIKPAILNLTQFESSGDGGNGLPYLDGRYIRFQCRDHPPKGSYGMQFLD